MPTSWSVVLVAEMSQSFSAAEGKISNETLQKGQSGILSIWLVCKLQGGHIPLGFAMMMMIIVAGDFC